MALPFIEKHAWFMEQMALLLTPWEDGFLRMRVHRENMLVESVEQLLGVQLEHIHMNLCIEYIGEEAAADADALKREWLALVVEKLFDETNGLFMCVHVGQLAYMPNANSAEATSDHLLYFRGAGRVLGRALLEGRCMAGHLTLPVLKLLLGASISLQDLEFVDRDVFKSLTWMMDNSVDALGLDFSVLQRRLSGDVVTIDLKENGRHVNVTDANKHEYIDLRLQYILQDSFAEQLEHLKIGLLEIVPQKLMELFDYQQLELALCGAPSINVDDWRAHTYVCDAIPDELLAWFWEIVQALSDEQRARLLQIATGSSRVPAQGFKALANSEGRVCLFTLEAVPFPENAYPRAHVCFNRMDLPMYSTKQQLEHALALVIDDKR